MIILKSVKVSEGWQETDGVKWRLVRNNTYQIQIICPKCGKLGNLWRKNQEFLVIHDREKYIKCRFGWCSEYHDVLEKIYNLCRKKLTIKRW